MDATEARKPIPVEVAAVERGQAVAGLTASTLVPLVLIPAVYLIVRRGARGATVAH